MSTITIKGKWSCDKDIGTFECIIPSKLDLKRIDFKWRITSAKNYSTLLVGTDYTENSIELGGNMDFKTEMVFYGYERGEVTGKMRVGKTKVSVWGKFKIQTRFGHQKETVTGSFKGSN